MPSLRNEITKTIHRLKRRHGSRPSAASLAETVVSTDAREGKTYRSYRILKRIGIGGMGQVYLALDTRLDRKVALKFLSAQFTSDRAMLKRLQEEASTASRLNHPGILTIYEIAEVDGEHFIASEFVEGETLRALIEKGEMPPQRALELMTDVTSALVAAHLAGVVHRDIKPSNIMVRVDGLVKVIDFGLAKSTHASAGAGELLSRQFSNPEAIAGTVEYMSPEQARGDPTDHRSDIWSLGIVLYEALCNKLPFDGETESHVVVGILDHPVPPLPYNPEFPRGVTKILDRALAKNREQRYQSAREMLADLEALAETPRRVSAFKRLAALPERKSTRLLPLTAVGVVLLTALGVWWWFFHGKEMVLGPNWFEPGPAEQITHDGNVKLAAISPDGKYLAYTTRNGETEELRIRNLATKTESQMQPFEDISLGLTFSPDSQSLYYLLKDRHEWGRLFSTGVDSVIPKLTLENIDEPITFSPDGKRFAFMRRVEEQRTSRESIVVASANDTGEQRTIASKANTQIRTLAWSPNGNRISAVVHKEVLNQAARSTLSLFTPGGAVKEEFLNPSLRTIKHQAWLNGGSLLAFSAMPQGSEHVRLYELSIPTGQFRSMPSPTLTPDSLGATSDGKTIAAVQMKQTSAIWVAPAAQLDSATQQVKEGDRIDSLAWSSTGGFIFPSSRSGSINLWEAASPAKARPLAEPKTCVETSPTRVPNSTQVIYSSNCAGGDDFNLWRMDVKTGERVQLTSGSSYDESPNVTPDGKWIVYTSWPSNIPSIWKIPVDGGAATPLFHVQARRPVVSPDGKSVLCQIREFLDGPWRVAVLSMSDGTVKQEMRDLPHTEDSVLRWSPDGKGIDFVNNRGKASNIWRRQFNGALRQLTHFETDRIYDFAWNGNGTMLAYVRGRAESDVVFFHRATASH
jgi:eukaryotic-like serine/threonine-protein kinase